MLNQLVLVGRLTKQPEVKELKDKKVTHITLAIPRSYKNSNGEYDTDFVPITLWNGIAENTTTYCRKGDIIGVKAKVQCTNNNLEIIAEKVTFLSSKHNEE